MLAIIRTSQFERDAKKARRRGKDLDKLEAVITLLANEKPLPHRCHDHPLSGTWSGYRDCHIEPDWLLIYIVKPEKGELHLVRAGTHADLY